MTRSEIYLMQDNGSKRSVTIPWYEYYVSFRHVVTVCVCVCGGGGGAFILFLLAVFLHFALNNVKRLLWNVYGIQK